MNYDTSFMQPQIPEGPVYNQAAQMPAPAPAGPPGMDEATRRRLAEMLMLYSQRQQAPQGGGWAGGLSQGLSNGIGAGAGLYGMMQGGGGY